MAPYDGAKNRWSYKNNPNGSGRGMQSGTKASLQKKDTSMTFWAEQKNFCHTYDTSMTIIVTKPGIIIDVVGSYFYDKKS